MNRAIYDMSPLSQHVFILVLLPRHLQVRRAVYQKPGLFSDFGDGNALHRIVHQHLRNDVAAALGEKARQAEHTICESPRPLESTLDFAKQRGDVLVIEGQAAAQKGVENDATGPHIHLGAGVHPAGDHLGRSVVGGAAGRVQKVAVLEPVRETEIGNLDVVVLVQKKVFRLQVTVHDVVRVAVLHSTDDLLEEAPRLVFG